jgi:hypothetical protein
MLHTRQTPYTGVMKKLLVIMLGLGLVIGSVAPTFAQNGGGKHGKGRKGGGHKGGTRGGGGPTR